MLGAMNLKRRHIVSLSGGIGSWACLDRVLQAESKEDITCVFCDTLSEDGDLYRFLEDIEKYYQIEIVRLCAGKTPFQLAWENNFVFNSRVARCSYELKSKPFREWLERNCSPDGTVIDLGIDWTESHRKAAIEAKYSPYKTAFPLCEPPYIEKWEALEMLREKGIRPPRMYDQGFSHNNCHGCCYKAGIGHYRTLLKVDPSLYREWEDKEQALIRKIGKDVGILRRHGKPYTLRQLRLDSDKYQPSLFDDDDLDVGGCGCFLE